MTEPRRQWVAIPTRDDPDYFTVRLERATDGPLLARYPSEVGAWTAVGELLQARAVRLRKARGYAKTRLRLATRPKPSTSRPRLPIGMAPRPRPGGAALCSSEDPYEMCRRCDCWKATRARCM